jgi:Flp pilus assembly protein protease CpaA
MNLKDVRLWPIWVACILMLAAAGINYQTLRVPNWLSLSSIVAAWLVALLVNVKLISTAGGEIRSSLVAMLIVGLLLLPFYALDYLGAGCVKMQMGFAAWIGCAIGLSRAATATAVATVAGGIVTAIAVAFVLQFGASYPDRLVLPQLFPAQVTLSLGSVGGLLAWFAYRTLRIA